MSADRRLWVTLCVSWVVVFFLSVLILEPPAVRADVSSEVKTLQKQLAEAQQKVDDIRQQIEGRTRGRSVDWGRIPRSKKPGWPNRR